MPTVLCDILNQILKNFHAKRASCFGVACGEKLYKLYPNFTELIIYTNSSL